MVAVRNSDDSVPMLARLLAAARECVLAVGWKRTTLTDVAQRAGVSRMSVYRTYPDMPSLFADLMTHEWAEVAAGVLTSPEEELAPDQIAAGIVGTVAALRRNELVRRALDLDPEWLLPYLLERRGRSQDALVDFLAERLATAQRSGAVRAGDPVLLARSIVLAAHGHALSVATMTDGEITIEALDQELVEVVRRYLAP